MIKLNLTDNWLGREGGQRICDMLTENCYIADLVGRTILYHKGTKYVI